MMLAWLAVVRCFASPVSLWGDLRKIFVILSVDFSCGLYYYFSDVDKIDIIRSTPITVKRMTKEECLEAHPGGISSADRGNEKNLNYV